MELQEVMPWLSAAALIISLGTAGWNIFQSPAKKNAKDIEDLDTAIGTEKAKLESALGLLRREVTAECKLIDDKTDALVGRVSHLETIMQQMPDKDSQHRLELSVSDMRGEFKEMRADLRPVAAIAERMQELLMRQAAEAAPARRRTGQ